MAHPPNLQRHRLIAELRASGLTLQEIAQRFRVSHQAICQILQHAGDKQIAPIYCRKCRTVIARRRTGAANNGPVYCMTCLPADATLGQRLKARRIAAALTLHGLAATAGVSWTTISRWECDMSEPKWRSLAKLIKVLGVDWLAVR